MTHQVRVIFDPAVGPAIELRNDLRSAIDGLQDNSRWPRRVLAEVTLAKVSRPESVQVFTPSRGEGLGAHVFVEVFPDRVLSAGWLWDQISAGLDAQAERQCMPARPGLLPVVVRGIGSPDEPTTVRIAMGIVGPPMPYLWTKFGLGEEDADLALWSWWEASGVTELEVYLCEGGADERPRVRLTATRCLVKVFTPRPAAGATDRQAMDLALAAWKRGLEAAAARVGLTQPPPLPSIEALVAYAAGLLDRDPASFEAHTQ